MVGAALLSQDLDGRSHHSGARAGIPVRLPELADSPQLVARPVRLELPLLPRQRPALANLVEGGGKPVETWATNYVPVFNLLPQGTYYWGVTPLDSQGNRGGASSVGSFTWSWPSTTTPVVTDLVAATEFFDPQFSWAPVPGATKYEVEVNSSQDFAPGSKVCCSQTTVSTSLAPTVVYRDNTYYWRVRALDAAGNSGVWNLGPSFTKTFDKVPPVTDPSIKNLHLRDNLADPGTDLDRGTPGHQTKVPMLVWDPVPGAPELLRRHRSVPERRLRVG